MSPASNLLVEQVPIDRLRPDQSNPRQITKAQLDALTDGIRAFGFVQPVVARRSDCRIIGGHQRLIAAIRLGYTEVPVVWVDLDDEQARLLSLGLNKLGGDWDERLLARLLADLARSATADLALTGFDDDELRRLLASLKADELRDRPETFDLEAALAKGRSGRTKPGELWQLGGHKLVIGDATDRTTIDRLLGDARPAMAFTDPPYGVAFGDHGGQQPGTRRRRIANDTLDPAAFEAFVTAWARVLVERVDGAIYVSMASATWPLVCRVLAEAGGHWSDTIIWRKDRFVLGRADYQRAYEPIWYGWPEGRSHHWCGDRDQDDVWEIPRPADSPLHPMTKPLALMERAISNSSRPGDLVLDLFGGSGSTLIACERTGRRCAMVEVDPPYGDVILARWEAFTGATAVRLSPTIAVDAEPDEVPS